MKFTLHRASGGDGAFRSIAEFEPFIEDAIALHVRYQQQPNMEPIIVPGVEINSLEELVRFCDRYKGQLILSMNVLNYVDMEGNTLPDINIYDDYVE